MATGTTTSATISVMVAADIQIDMPSNTLNIVPSVKCEKYIDNMYTFTLIPFLLHKYKGVKWTGIILINIILKILVKIF